MANTTVPMPAAGQTWRAPAPRVKGGYRYVVLEQVRRASEPKYALAREVTAAGNPVRPDRLRPYRSMIFTIYLDPVTETLRPPYERVEVQR